VRLFTLRDTVVVHRSSHCLVLYSRCIWVPPLDSVVVIPGLVILVGGGSNPGECIEKHIGGQHTEITHKSVG
jgi:hypothetical protein